MLFVPAFAKSSSISKDFNHTFTLDLERFDPALRTRIPLNVPFKLTVQIQVVNRMVTIRVPAFNFNLVNPKTEKTVTGFVYTQSGNLPRKLWPADVVPEAFVILSDGTGQGYQLSIGPDGSFNISARDSNAISPGGDQVLHATTISYLIPPRNKPPQNFKINKKPFSVIGTTVDTVPFQTDVGIYDFQDFWQNDIVKVDDTIYTAFIFPDTSGAPVPPGRISAAVRRGILKNGKIKFDPVTVPKVNPPNVFDGESRIAINPTNPDNMVRVTYRNDFRTAAFGTSALSTTVASSTFDGGRTWTTTIVTPPKLLPYDPALIFDSFGNCWVADVIAQIPGDFFSATILRVRISTDGGLTFKTAFEILTRDIAGAGVISFPNFAFGPDGAGGNALWFAYDDRSFTDETDIPFAGFIRVTGLGKFDSTPTFFPINSVTPNQATSAQLVIGPTGKVYIGLINGADNSFRPGGGPLGDGNISFLIVNPTGTVGFNANSFGPRQDIYFSNTAFVISPTVFSFKPTPWQPQRGIIPAPRGFLGFDNKRNRLYACGWDMRPNLSNNDPIFVMYSEDDGQSWSNPFIVNDVVKGSRSMATMAVEPLTGVVSVGFFDPRNHLSSQQKADYYASIFKAPRKVQSTQKRSNY